MNIKAFFVAALSSALELGVAAPEDVLRHVTPDVLSIHLPRPLWARLLTAALGAPHVDATLIVETIGVPNLCEHIPSTIMWACLAEVGQRALAGGVPAQPSAKAAPGKAPLLVSSPPPEIKRDTPPRGTPVAVAAAPIPKPAEGLADVVAALESDERQAAPAGRGRTPTGQRFRQNPTGISRLGAINTRRPQAPVTAADEPTRTGAAPTPPGAKPRRGETEADESYAVDAEVKDDWKSSLAVEDEQLVDWQASEATQTAAEEYRKR